MKRRGFLLNTTVLLLIIPLLLLLATYEDASSYIISAQGERVQAERTFDVVSYLTLDFQKAIELSGKRALVAAVDYVVTTGNFIDPNVGANNTIRDLIVGDTNNPITTNPDVQKLMRGQDIRGWVFNVSRLLREQGYILEPNASQIANNIDMLVAPLDSFHVVIRVRLTNVTIRDLSGKVVYTGPIPKKGYVYSIINIQQLEDPYYSVMSGGRYHRSIRACNYAFPAFTAPFAIANGTGAGKTVAGIFGEDFKYDSVKIWDARNTSIYIANLTIGTSRISPANFILNNGDTGVIVMNASAGTGWCDTDFEHRVRITLPQTAPSNSLVLLVFETSAVASSFGSAAHSGNSASIRVYDEDCNPVRYWIEHWGTDKILIWLKTTSTKYYSVYYSSNPGLESDGDITIFPYFIQDFTLVGGERNTALLFKAVPFSSFFIRYGLSADSNTTDFDAGLSLCWSSAGGSYLQVNVSYPDNVQDVQVPIYLNSTIAREVRHNSANESEIEVYSDPELTNPLPFWIEYWNDNGALIWVRMDIPGTVYIRYNTGTLTRGDGDEVFLFFDDFTENSLNTSKWNVRNPRGSYSVSNGVLSLRGNNNRNNADVWLWTKERFPYYRYVIGMKVYIQNQPTWLWYIDSTSWGWMEHIIGQYGYLGDLNVQTGRYDDKLNTGGGYVKKKWSRIEIAVRDYWRTIWWTRYHLADFTIYQNKTGPFIGTWSGGTVQVSHYYYYQWYNQWYYISAREDTAIGIGQFYKGPSLYDFIYVRKYLNLNELSTHISEVASQVSSTVQLLDDNPGHADLTGTGSGGDWLVILSNWSKVLASTSTATDYKGVLNRYEVDVVKGDGSMDFSFIHNPNSTVNPTSSSGALEAPVPPSIDILAAIDNTQNNNAHFSWVIAAPYPYASYSWDQLAISAQENRPPIVGELARVYDLQPFIDCIKDGGYFGIYNGLSFFERLEEPPGVYSDITQYKNHGAYIRLAHKMQDELGYKYRGHYYPIGLVSFLIPHGLYDEKLVNIFNSLGIRLDNTTSADYYFLPRYFLGISTRNGYRVWGVSLGVVSTTDLSLIPFYLDPDTASAIFGPVYSRDLLYGYNG